MYYYLMEIKVQMNKRVIQLKRTMKKVNRYTKEQIWNLDFYLTEHICCALKQFKNQRMYSYPSQFNSEKEWIEILNQIIWSMEKKKNDYPNDPLYNYKYCIPIDGKDIYSQEERDKAKKESAIYYKKIDEGLHLFAKYLQDLWI